jgi:hypothetical protein
VNAPVHQCDGDAMPFGNVAPRLTAATEQDDASVGGLFRSCSPDAVLRAIPKAIVFALYRKALSIAGLLSPCFEFGEVVPFSAYTNALRSVVLEGSGFGVVAARPHCLPNAIQRRRLSAVDSRSLSGFFNHQATTGSRFLRAQVCAMANALRTARAHATPEGSTPLRVASFLYNFPPTKLLASEVY